jgi:hypothetical protein
MTAEGSGSNYVDPTELDWRQNLDVPCHAPKA